MYRDVPVRVGTYAKPPWPIGPKGRKTLTITVFGGNLYSVRRIK